MLELGRATGGWRLGYGGDTLNTAIHLSRAGHDVAYLTALGSDALSETLKPQWAREGLDVSLVLQHPRRNTGLYAISTDAAGERSFTYWRDTSAARDMFALPEINATLEIAGAADLIGFSLITLAILPLDGQNRLLEIARQVRQRGGHVAFDGNYRARLWTDVAEARAARDAAIACATIGLPTLEDETALSGEATSNAVAMHWQGLGCTETIVKAGSAGCRLPDGSMSDPPQVLSPVDTSGAGDAFNAGYLGARLAGANPDTAAREGHARAAWTIMRPGAIPPREA
ncbi:MAG: sugar kinase [Sphingomonadales bacterium]